jgi:acetyltransferase-like isoleucine patch superfamily enzyme
MARVPELRTQIKGPLVNIGAHTYASTPPKVLSYHWPITIGKYCSFAWDIEFVITGGHHADCVSTYPFDNLDNWPEANTPLYPHHKGLEIQIGNDVWVGCGVRIMHNAPIGDGAVIGAYSVLREAVRPYAIVLGNPAEEVGRRFDDETVDRLLELKWWDWPEEKVREHIKLITGNDLEALCSVS